MIRLRNLPLSVEVLESMEDLVAFGNPILEPTASAAFRDQLIAELKELNSSDEASTFIASLAHTRALARLDVLRR